MVNRPKAGKLEWNHHHSQDAITSQIVIRILTIRLIADKQIVPTNSWVKVI